MAQVINPTGTHFTRLVSLGDKPLNLLIKVKGNDVTLYSSTIDSSGRHRLISNTTTCDDHHTALVAMEDVEAAFKDSSVRVTSRTYLA